MDNISIKINQDSKYTINVKEEYDLNEFISTFEGHISLLKNMDLGNKQSKKIVLDKEENNYKYPSSFLGHPLIKELDMMIRNLGTDITIKDDASMRSYYSISKFNRKTLGLAWLKPIGNNLLIHLRKVDYKSIDTNNRIKYSEEGSRTFGDYPTLTIYNNQDLEYAFELIRYAYTN